ncbi:Cytosolic copper metallochaperone [Cryptotrichosporon argae]
MAQIAPTAPAYEYRVKMTCGGCSGAVERVLKKNIEAPNAFHVSLATQRVVVWGPALPPFDDLTAKIAKTGKEVLDKREVQAGAVEPIAA